MNRMWPIWIYTVVFVFVEVIYACCVKPVANFSISPNIACVGQTVSFNGTSSYDPDGTTLSYSWNFGAGATNITGAGTATPTCQYTSTDNKTVTLTVTDCDSCIDCGSNKTSNPKTLTLTVVGIGSVTTSDTNVCAGQEVTFTAVSTPAGKTMNCLEWQVRWKDPEAQTWGNWSTIGSGNPAVFSSTTAGYVQYRARNGSGDTWKVSAQVTVVDVAKIQYNDRDSGWTDVTGTLYAYKGGQIEFKAIASPEGAWFEGKPEWSGSSGATGSGETKTVTFNTISSSGSDYTVIASCCDSHETVNVIVCEVEVTDVTFDHESSTSGHNDALTIFDVVQTPEWEKDVRNEPAVYVMNTANIDIKAGFRILPSVSSPETTILATSGSTLGNVEEKNIVFSGSTVSELFSLDGSSAAAIDKSTVTWQWKVKDFGHCLPGEFDINTSGSHTIYTIYNDPSDISEFTKDHIERSVDWGSGGQEVTENDIPKKIQENCWLNFDWTHLSDPWDLETTGGDCQTHAELIAAALSVLGIGADGTTESTCRVGETRICPIPGHGVEYHWFIEAAGSHTETNFEGVCKVDLIDEDTPWTCYYDKAMGSPYQEGNHTNMWTEWFSYPPPNCKVVFEYTDWENHP